MKADRRELARLCLSSNHSVRLPDRATLVAGPFQAFIGNFRPELFQLRRCRLVGVPFCIIRSPGHLGASQIAEARRRLASMHQGLIGTAAILSQSCQ